MNKWIISISVLIIILFALVFLNYRNSSTIVLNGFAQGTTYHIVYIPDFSVRFLLQKNQFNFQEEIDSLLDRFNQSLSVYHPESVISRINKNDSLVEVDDLFEKVFQRASEVSSATNGAFDITIGPVVNTWGFGPGEKGKVDSVTIDSLLQFVGMDKVSIVAGRVVKTNPGIVIDVNAIAQGFSVDLVAALLENQGIDNYLVELGGEVKASGTKQKGELWLLGIDKPIDNNLIPGQDLQAKVSLHNRSLATSGNYRKFYEENGIKYSHTIDPETGFPVRHNLLSVTVIANDCMTADAYATAFMVMGLDKSIEMISQMENLEGYFIYAGEGGEFETYATEGFEEMIVK